MHNGYYNPVELSRSDELSFLINDHKPTAICLQETFLKDKDDITIKYHSIYNKIFTEGEKARGGVSVIVNNIPHKPVSLNTNLQAVAVRLSLHNTLTLCSLYLPPSTPIDQNKLNDLVSQLPSPFILAGDFNGHNVIWGCDDNNQRGLQLENFISNKSLSFMNDNKSKTYLHPATGFYSSIDLTLCSPVLLPNFTWKVTEDLCGSDHFPILLSSTQPSSNIRPQKWKLSKANWNKFETLCELSITRDKLRICAEVIIFPSFYHLPNHPAIYDRRNGSFPKPTGINLKPFVNCPLPMTNLKIAMTQQNFSLPY